ncbi:putative ubiquitin-like activating enzyme [Talaromyces proteolyticus]|uniref:NEDD8-activating enzyme E1 regulatory subunit n=1 Tax=Talaromyces proteolyticus TaxID=1131652 RepID=A0AAD4KP62_9EURO|nr:putative ubiquitin-like activating enzyme [Talaromyces proteolyticus]KAH8696309.1 putative ubiquitin-like activating enzyme [Talaromyces proteolyticus]
MTDQFPAALVGPSSKERKYDRQLRLWAASGQQALEQSRVLLVNSDGFIDGENTPIGGVAGVETLKNLVLPGVGGFTIVDPAIVSETDLGINFFLEESSLGKSRAQETCNLLKELNPDVDGDFKVEPISDLLQQPDFLSQYKLVVVSGPIKRSSLDAITSSAEQLGVPLIYVRSVGFYSSFSLQLPTEFPIVETHPDPESTQDLRLTNPWPELHAVVSQIANLEALDDHDHGHVPYILLLLYYLDRWKAEHDGKAPENYKEKTAFRDLVRSGARTNNAEGGEENFDEAVSAVLKSINPWSLRSNIREIFDMDQCTNLKTDYDNFWIIASALKAFYTKHNVLPLPGSLPDMKAKSADYITLQNIFKSKARQDVEEVLATVRSIETQLCDRTAPVTEKEVEVFCKNASHVKVIRGRQIPRISTNANQTLKTIRNGLGNPESKIPTYIAFEALDVIVDGIQNEKLTPNALDNDDVWNTTIERLLVTIAEGDNSVINAENRESVTKAAQELRRTVGGELHNISSLTGGLVSQEALKVLTRQYVPLDNTCIFDGVSSGSEMFRL